jgi:hypothetical protein
MFEAFSDPASASSPDTLLSMTINGEWRKLIVGALENYLQQDNGEISLDNQDLLAQIFEELYNP